MHIDCVRLSIHKTAEKINLECHRSTFNGIMKAKMESFRYRIDWLTVLTVNSFRLIVHFIIAYTTHTSFAAHHWTNAISQAHTHTHTRSSIQITRTQTLRKHSAFTQNSRRQKETNRWSDFRLISLLYFERLTQRQQQQANCVNDRWISLFKINKNGFIVGWIFLQGWCETIFGHTNGTLMHRRRFWRFIWRLRGLCWQRNIQIG